MSWTEILGFVTGALAVWLTVKENVWNWPVGIANVSFFLFLFWGAGLYADAGLQVVYIGLGFYGWWNWLFGGQGRTTLPISRTRTRTAILLVVAAAGATTAMTWVLAAFTESTVPFWDAVTTALSLTAMYMLTRKLIENWWVWITADVMYIALYAYKELYLTAVLYAIFLAMCFAGLREWRQTLATQGSTAEVTA